jgi:menaquinone-9 beta-reductase
MAGCDAIAVGGGLAGAAFALGLLRRGGRVTIVERQRSAEHKVCGDFLSFEAQQVLADLGIDVGAMGARPAERLRFVAGRSDAIAALPFTGVAISRRALDEAMLVAAERAGATVLRGQAARAIEATARSVRVQVGSSMLEADVAVLASGKHNLRGLPRRASRLTAFKMVFEPTSAATHALDRVVQLASYRGGYIGSCILEDGALSVCWLASAGFLGEAGHDWRAQLDWIARRTPAVGDLIAGAKPTLRRPAAVSSIPFGYRRRNPAADNIYAVGDQLAVIHSFTGDGTSIALMSGVAAAEALCEGRDAAAFQRDLLRRVAPQMHWAALVGTTFWTAFGRWSSVATVRAVPRVATLLAGVTRIRLPAGDASNLQIQHGEVGGKARPEGGEQMASPGA